MDPNFPESNGPVGARVIPTPEPLLGQTTSVADWKATFEGGPPITCVSVFIIVGVSSNVIVSFYASALDKVQYTPNDARRIRSEQGCLLPAFDIVLNAG